LALINLVFIINSCNHSHIIIFSNKFTKHSPNMRYGLYCLVFRLSEYVMKPSYGFQSNLL
jgi:hypothetical protein